MKELKQLIEVIESAGLMKLSRGVQLGEASQFAAASWYFKASEAMIQAKLALSSQAPAVNPRYTRLAEAAIAFCRLPENIEAYEDMKQSRSAALPVEFINLMEACESLTARRL